MIADALAVAGAVIWILVIVLPWRAWSTRERMDEAQAGEAALLDDVTVLIPARNEAPMLGETLPAVAAQGQCLRIIVIDDASSDATADVAIGCGIRGLRVIEAGAMPRGWTGKLWALEQGRAMADRPFVVLLDADIALAPGVLRRLRERLLHEHLGLASLMVRLDMSGFWGKLLHPAFVFFFKLLYPFRLSNSRRWPVAAAAGGCIMLRREALADIGGFAGLRDALIDDCALARRIKKRGYGTWIGLTRQACSLRSGTHLRDVWQMVVRTAFTQLAYSPYWLAVCTVLMLGAFAGPVLGLFSDSEGMRVTALLGLAAMCVAYVPTLRYLGRSWAWALALPLTGTLFLMMTWHSAVRYWCGSRSRWKGRSYPSAVSR